MINREILNYKIEKVIGEGGMGTVYRASHTKIPNRIAAIKVLKSNFLQNENLKNRFRREMEIMATISHENIIKLEQFDEDQIGMYLIMEYFDGLEIDNYLKNKIGIFPEEKAIPIMVQILKAMGFAHKQGIIHRDIKPANILINQEGTIVKILDFGIAKMKDDISMATKSGAQIGTVFYMSPEQVLGKELDFRSDIYALGVTFYQMLTGINPYQDLNTEYEIYNKITKEELPDPREIYPAVSEQMVNILKKALAKDPNIRFQSCEEFISALQGKIVVEPIPYGSDILAPLGGGDDVNKNSFYISVFISIISVIPCLNPDLYYLSLFFALMNLVYFYIKKEEIIKAHQSSSILVFSSILIAFIGSAYYLFS